MTDPEALLGRHTGLIWKVARAFAETHADQHDLFQEILLTVWTASGAFKGDVKESTFVYRVAFNRAISWQRKRKTYRRHLRAYAADRRVASVSLDTHDSAGDLDALYEAIRGLPDIDRSIVLMHLDGCAYREIAGVLGISESNVGARLSRVRKRLSQKLGSGVQNDET